MMTSGLQNAIDKALAKEGRSVKFTGDRLSDIATEDIKKPKYVVAPVQDRTVDGIVFDSKGEMQRYLDLRLQEKSGLIESLNIQPEFTLQEGYYDYRLRVRILPIKYIADFSYMEKGRQIVEDFKGHKTKDYKMKNKMFRKKYPSLEFKETGTSDIL